MGQEAIIREYAPKLFDPLLRLGILWSLALQRSQGLSRAGTQSQPTQRQIFHPRTVCGSPFLGTYFFILIFTSIPILLTSIVYARLCMCVGTSVCAGA